MIWLLFFLLFNISSATANTVAPAGLDAVLKKIESRQHPVFLDKPARIAFKDNQIIFFQDDPSVKAVVSFKDQSPTIFKRFNLMKGVDGYKFSAILQDTTQSFKTLVKKVNHADALVFFNDSEFFIYTQKKGMNNSFELQEWIYALKPNQQNGSKWIWELTSDQFQWPLTMGLNDDKEAVINRNVPIRGFPIEGKALTNYMLQVMVRFKNGEQVKKYFPFSEQVASIKPASAWSKEGTPLSISYGIKNATIDKPIRQKPKFGFDFGAWEDYWLSLYIVSVSADSSQYPILIGPQDDQ